MSVKPLTEHHLEFLSLNGGCTGSSESTLVKMPHCWKSHVVAHTMRERVQFLKATLPLLPTHAKSSSHVSVPILKRIRDMHKLSRTRDTSLFSY